MGDALQTARGTCYLIVASRPRKTGTLPVLTLERIPDLRGVLGAVHGFQWTPRRR